MSKSYRKPYATWVSAKRSAHADKKAASRAYRHMANQKLRSFDGDWEEFINPVKHEASCNDIWGWSMDGPKVYIRPTHKDFNPYQYSRFTHWQTMEEFWQDHEESLVRNAEYHAWLRRK